MFNNTTAEWPFYEMVESVTSSKARKISSIESNQSCGNSSCDEESNIQICQGLEVCCRISKPHQPCSTNITSDEDFKLFHSDNGFASCQRTFQETSTKCFIKYKSYCDLSLYRTSLFQQCDSASLWKRLSRIRLFLKQRKNRRKCHFSSPFLLQVLVFLLSIFSIVQGKELEVPRYETAYACEGKTLKIECRDGEVINLIRANYGRFSITICNEHGNTDWSVNCMSAKTLSVLHNRCSKNQNCSILASTSMFGDPCKNTLKYLEAHYQCIPAATPSSTFRPSPPWLTTSQPSLWRSTVQTPIENEGLATNNSSEKDRLPSPAVHHLPPPTFRPHITMPTMPPDLRVGVVKQVKPDVHSDVSKAAKSPAVVTSPTTDGDVNGSPKVEHQAPKSKTVDEFHKEATEHTVKTAEKDILDFDSSKETVILPPPENENNPIENDETLHRHHHHNHHEFPPLTHPLPLKKYCSPEVARGLQWNWTAVGEVAVQPCPGGATGLARWRCINSTLKITNLQQKLGASNREILPDQIHSRTPVLLDTLGADSLLTGRDEIELNSGDFQDESGHLMLPDALASTTDIENFFTENKYKGGEGKPVWISESPDLSECRSVWLNSLEMRIKEGESLLSISNDLNQVTSLKTLYGGDMMTTTNIMKRLAQKMEMNIQTLTGSKPREAIVAELLSGVVSTGSNLLDVSQQASWKDLSHPVQMRVATSLLTGLEENAFLLAEAILREKTIVHASKNILLVVRVLETRNVETEEFPTALAKEKWSASQDTIHLPRRALIDNSEGGLVRIVFVAFDRLEEILQPPNILEMPVGNSLLSRPSMSPEMASSTNQKNGDKDNITRVINSKVISASLRKGRHIQLSQPVKLILRHLKIDNVSNPTCVFWDYTIHGWSTEGCKVEWTNKTHTSCQCSHLTNFALLMDVHAVPLSAGHSEALQIITVVGCAISVVALLAAIVFFHCCKGMKSDRITIHKNLCACLLFAELIFMFGIDYTRNKVACGFIAGFLHYFFLAAFAWMFLEGFQLYAMLVEVFEPERARSRWYYPVAYVVPLVIVLISAAVDPHSYGTDRNCWLRADNYFILTFIIPVAIVLLANWVCLSMVIYMMCHHSNVSIKAKENTKLYKIKIWLRGSICLAFLLGLTWTFGLLYLNEETVIMAYLFTVLNSLQGLFIFIFHCLLNESFQKECGRLGRRYQWLSCCAKLGPQGNQTGAGGAATTGSSSTPSNQPPATHSKHRHHHHTEEQCLEDVSDREHTNTMQRYSMNQQQSHVHHLQEPTQKSWTSTVRPTAPQLVHCSSEEQSSAPHSLSMPSIHGQGGYSSQTTRVGTPVPIELQLDHNDIANRSRSPSCFSVKMGNNGTEQTGWGVVQNPLSSANVGTWKNTSSKNQQVSSQSSLHHLEHQGRRNDVRSANRYLTADLPRHSQHRQPHYHHHHPHHAYSEIGRYRRASDQEYRDVHDDPVYEEIERNETLMSDMSDDNSGHCEGFVRPNEQAGHHKFYGDHRPLISYSPGERHRYNRSPINMDHQIPHGKYATGRWDSLDRHADRSMYMYHPQEGSNMRTLAAVLNGDNDVASKVLCPGHGHGQHPRNTLPSYSDC